MDNKCQRCTRATVEYLIAQYERRHEKAPSEDKAIEIARKAADICVEVGKPRGWLEEVIGA